MVVQGDRSWQDEKAGIIGIHLFKKAVQHDLTKYRIY